MPSSTSRGGTSPARRASSASARTSPAGRPPQGARPRPSAAGARAPDDEPTQAWPARRWWVLGLIVVALAIMLVPTARRYVAQRQQIAALSEHIAVQEEVVDDLARQRARWDDPAYLETQARERLHFVKPGETGYTVTTRQDAQAARTDPQVVGVDASAAGLPWYQKVWGSLQAADRLGAQVQRTPAPNAPPSTSPTATDTTTDTPTPTLTGRRRH